MVVSATPCVAVLTSAICVCFSVECSRFFVFFTLFRWHCVQRRVHQHVLQVFLDLVVVRVFRLLSSSAPIFSHCVIWRSRMLWSRWFSEVLIFSWPFAAGVEDLEELVLATTS